MTGCNSVCLLDYLDETDRATVLSGGDPGNIGEAINAALDDTGPGATIDASMLQGSIVLATDPFAGFTTAERTLVTGPCTFRRNVKTLGAIELPSKLTWRWEGTRYEPTENIDTWPGAYDQGAGIIETKLFTGTCTGTLGGNTITVNDASALLPGSALAIVGIAPFTNIQHQVTEALTSSTPSTITLTPSIASTIDDSKVYLKIDDEIIRVSCSGTVTIEQRGDLGTTAAAHSAGSTATLMVAKIYKVVSVAGNVATLDGTLDRSFSNAPWWAGTVGTRIEGWGVIDGLFLRNYTPNKAWVGVLSTLSRDFSFSGGFEIRHCYIANVFLQGAQNAVVRVTSMVGNGVPASGVGAAVVFYGNCYRCHVEADIVADGYEAVAFDSKSSNVTRMGLTYGPLECSTHIKQILSHHYSVEMSGANACSAVVDYDEATNGVFIYTSLPQVVTPLTADNNSVLIGRSKHFGSYSPNPVRVTNAANNSVVINGRSGRVIEQDVAIAGAINVPANSGVAANVTLTGALPGDNYTAMPLADLPLGVIVQATKPPSNNVARLMFANGHTATRTTSAPSSYRIRATGPWNP